MRQKHVAVTIRKGGTIKHFQTMSEAAFHIGVSRGAISKALKEERDIEGWTVVREGGERYTEAQVFRLYKTQGETTKVKEIFTRKPFEATGIWRKRDA